MAGHADAAEQVDVSTPDDEEVEVTAADAEEAVPDAGRPARQLLSGTRAAIVFGLVVVAALAGVAGWFGYRSDQAREAQAQRTEFVQIARQAAVNLTTISYTEADADVKRILDSATGEFRDDFQQRSQPFVDVVKQAQSKSEGTVTEAGLISTTGDGAQVLVAVSMKTSTAVGPDQDPRRYRLRISVQKTNDGTKVSNVEFVP